MRYGVEVVNGGPFADPRTVVRVAQAAESSGWEGLFVWDHLAFVWGAEFADPWVTLSAMAASTSRMRLGTVISPLPRYRPQVLAHLVATLDVLSGGRTVLGAGLGGVPEEFTAFGEPGDARERASMLDEGLRVVSRLWSGEKVTHRGRHYSVEGVTLSPLPVQRPRVPVWIGGESRAALRRAARWDGWVVSGASQDGRTMSKRPEDIAKAVRVIRVERTIAATFEVAMTGYSEPGDEAIVSEYADAGVTWWLESVNAYRGSVDGMLQRLSSGPPA